VRKRCRLDCHKQLQGCLCVSTAIDNGAAAPRQFSGLKSARGLGLLGHVIHTTPCVLDECSEFDAALCVLCLTSPHRWHSNHGGGDFCASRSSCGASTGECETRSGSKRTPPSLLCLRCPLCCCLPSPRPLLLPLLHGPVLLRGM
jgi:hypothetical protein